MYLNNVIAFLECGRSSVRAAVGSNQIPQKWYKLILGVIEWLLFNANSAISLLSTHLWGVRAKAGWFGIIIMCTRWATCPPAVVSVSYYYKNQIERVDLVQSGHHHHFIHCNLFSLWHSWKIAHLILNNHHSLTMTYDSSTKISRIYL
jgi:hypothetical protein